MNEKTEVTAPPHRRASWMSRVAWHLRAAMRGEGGIGALLIRGTSGGVLLTGFNTLATFGTAILLARMLGAEKYGIYAYAISWITLLGVFAKAGIDQVMVRNIAVYHHSNDWAHIRGMLRFGIALVSVAAGFCAVGSALLAWWLHADTPNMRDAIWIACLLLPLQALSTPLGTTQQGLLQVVNAQLPNLLITPLVFLLAIGSVYLMQPSTAYTAEQALLIRVVAVGCGLSTAVMLLRRGLRQGGRPASLPEPVYEVNQWLRSALPLMLMGSMFMINANADILMLGTMIGAREAGLYQVATRGAELVTLMLTLINAPLGPIIARLHAAGDTRKLQRILKLSALAAFIPALLLAAAMILRGDWFLRLFGADFQGRDAAIALAILCVGQLINVGSGPVGLLAIMSNGERFAARILAFSSLLNIGLNAILIPRMGIVGAAIATAISTVAWNLLLVWFIRRRFGLDPTALPTPSLMRMIK